MDTKEIRCGDLMPIDVGVFAVVVNTEHILKEGECVTVNNNSTRRQAILHRVILYRAQLEINTYGLNLTWSKSAGNSKPEPDETNKAYTNRTYWS